jgi:hypothetical protein
MRRHMVFVENMVSGWKRIEIIIAGLSELSLRNLGDKILTAWIFFVTALTGFQERTGQLISA